MAIANGITLILMRSLLCNIQKKSTDGCEAETTDGGYEWVETDLGDYASSDCPCAEYLLSLAGSAFRFCGGDYGNGAQWSDEVDVTECVALSSQTTRRLCQAIIVSREL